MEEATTVTAVPRHLDPARPTDVTEMWGRVEGGVLVERSGLRRAGTNAAVTLSTYAEADRLHNIYVYYQYEVRPEDNTPPFCVVEARIIGSRPQIIEGCLHRGGAACILPTAGECIGCFYDD